MVKRPSYGDMIDIDLPDDPGPIETPTGDPTKRRDDSPTTQSYDRTSPKRGTTVSRRVSAVTARERRERAKATPKAGPDEYIQRSIYARQATFDAIAKLAREKGDPIQHFYREALLLLMRKHKLADSMNIDDV